MSAMFEFLRGRKKPSIEQAEAMASLWERFFPSPKELVLWVIALFGPSGGVMIYLFSWFEPIARHGWAAIVLAGIGAACIIILCIAILLIALRLSKAPPPLSNELKELVLKGTDIAAKKADQAVESFAVLTRTEILELKTSTAILNEEVEKLRSQQATIPHKLKLQIDFDVAKFSAEIRNEMLKEIELLTEKNDKTNEFAQGTLAGVNRAIAKSFEETQNLRDELGSLTQEFIRTMKARDDKQILYNLDCDATKLFLKLRAADKVEYIATQRWLADYTIWRSLIENFWSAVRKYSGSVEQPFMLDAAELEREEEMPANDIFFTSDMRHRYQTLLVVNERHSKFKKTAFSFLADLGTPKSPNPTGSP